MTKFSFNSRQTLDKFDHLLAKKSILSKYHQQQGTTRFWNTVFTPEAIIVCFDHTSRILQAQYSMKI